MGLAAFILLVALCTMLQVPPAAAVSIRSRRRPPSSADFGPLDSNQPAEQRRVDARLLSSVCCGGVREFDVAAGACRAPRGGRASAFAPASAPGPAPAPAHGLLHRSRLTELPPNCPPPQKYDPEGKVCRDIWRKRRK